MVEIIVYTSQTTRKSNLPNSKTVKSVTVAGARFFVFVNTENMQIFLAILTFTFIQIETRLHIFIYFCHVASVPTNYVQYI